MMKADSIAARDELDWTSFLIDREFINAQTTNGAGEAPVRAEKNNHQESAVRYQYGP